MKTIERILKILTTIMAWLSAVCISLMMVQVCADVILKYVINMPIMGTAEVVANYYMLAAVFLPLALVETRNAGVSITLFYDLTSRVRLRRMMVLLAFLGQAIFFAMLAYKTGGDALESYEKLEMVEGQVMIYIWPGTFFLPLGFGVVALLNALRFIQVMFASDFEKIIE